MPNPFDQFDEQPPAASGGNPFDQFDEQPSAPSPATTMKPAQGGGRSAVARRGNTGGDDAIVKLKKFVTGEDRRTSVTDQLPELQSSGLLSGESPAVTAKLAPVLLTTTDPDEITKIITENVPNVVATYNKDAKGNVFPILTNRETGAQTIINRPGLTGMDIIQSLGLGAAYTPAGRGPSIVAAGAKAVATEGAIQGAQKAAGGSFDAEQLALAGVTGAVGKAIEDVAGAGVRALKGSAANEVVDAGKDAGIPVFTSDIMPPKTFAGRHAQQMSEKIPLVGMGGPREAQQIMRQKAVDKVAEKYSDYSFDAIVQSLKSQSNRVKRAAGNVIESTGNQLDQVGEIPLNNTQAAIQRAKTELSKPGVLKSSSALEDLDQLIKTFSEAPQLFTTLKENRTAFREIINGIDKAERSQLGSRAKSLLGDVAEGMTQDMKSFAKNNLSPREYDQWLKANSVYADEAKKLTKTKLKNILDKGDLTPESVKSMLFSSKPSELNSLYSSLTPSGRSNARSAIISKIFENLSRRQSGVTPNSFVGEMRKMKPQIETFFKGDEFAQLKGLERVLEATKRAQDAAVTTPTGQQLIGGLSIAGLYLDPASALGTAGTLGGLTRLYESGPVRTALLRLGSVPRGSTAYEKALREAQTALTAAAQTARATQSDSQ